MRITEQQLAEYLALGERQSIEFKPSRPRGDARAFAAIARAVIAMANHKDGGTVVLGVEDVDNVLEPVGMNPADIPSWNENDVKDGLANFADPYVNLEIQVIELETRAFVVLNVDEFEEVPVICKRDFDDVTKRGRLYVRPRGKPRSVEVPGQTEMREVLELATAKGIRKFLTSVRNVGLTAAPPSDADSFREQRGPDFS